MTYELISTIEIGAGGASSIEFTGIPQDGTDLVCVVSARSSSSAYIAIQFNSSSTSFSTRRLIGTGSSVSSDGYSLNIAGDANTPTSTASTFSSTQIYVSNYAGSANKSYSVESVQENNATAANQYLIAGLWSNTAAITGLKLALSAGNYEQYSTASLYKITAGDSGQLAQPKATGGTVSYSGGYWYHTFTSSGTFTPTESLTCDYLVVAGGGGGATVDTGGTYFGGGGGGAGGYLSGTTTISSAETITVGAGGSIGTIGSTSSIGAIVSSTGGGGGTTSLNGGSGAGGSRKDGAATGPGTGISGQGNNGGGGSGDGTGGGGGGAGAVGGTASGSTPGNGGAGSTWLNSVTYAGGGGGGNWDYGRGTGGAGGGGAGASSRDGLASSAGAANRGGGGGGAGYWSATGSQQGAAGGSGIVIVRYAA